VRLSALPGAGKHYKKTPEAAASGVRLVKTSQPFTNGAAKENPIIFSGDMCG